MYSPFTSIIPFSPGQWPAFTQRPCPRSALSPASEQPADCVRYHSVPRRRASHAAVDPDSRPADSCEESCRYPGRRDQGPGDCTAPQRYSRTAPAFVAPRQAARIVSLDAAVMQADTDHAQQLQADASTRNASARQSRKRNKRDCCKPCTRSQPFREHALAAHRRELHTYVLCPPCLFLS
jgi:hypothetical protein